MSLFPFWTSWALHTESVQGLLWCAQGSSPEHYIPCDPQTSGCWGWRKVCSPNLWTFWLWPRFSWDRHDCNGAQWHLSCRLHLERLKTAQLHYSRRRRLHKCNWSHLRWVIWDLLRYVLISALLLSQCFNCYMIGLTRAPGCEIERRTWSLCWTGRAGAFWAMGNGV